MHECPASTCDSNVSDDMLMCRRHWRLVPPDLQRAVYRAWRDGAGAGTPEHIRACRDAVIAADAAVEQRRRDHEARQGRLL